MSVVSIAEAWPAPGKPFTVAELDRMPDDGHRYELVDGALLVSPRLTRWWRSRWRLSSTRDAYLACRWFPNLPSWSRPTPSSRRTSLWLTVASFRVPRSPGRQSW